MSTNHTTNYDLNQWEASDKVLRTEFNSDNAKIDAALKANADAIAAEAAAREAADETIAAGNCWVKVLDATLETETQKWNIDMSGIDLSLYQKLTLHPHLKGNSDQWVELRINHLDSGYHHENDDATSCGEVPLINDSDRQNFGVCEYTVLIELPQLYVIQTGVTADMGTYAPSTRSYRYPRLSAGTTSLSTLDLEFDNPYYHLQAGSTIQIYGLKK